MPLYRIRYEGTAQVWAEELINAKNSDLAEAEALARIKRYKVDWQLSDEPEDGEVKSVRLASKG